VQLRKEKVRNAINSYDFQSRETFAVLIEYGGGGVLWTPDYKLVKKSMVRVNASVLLWIETMLQIMDHYHIGNQCI
jgi:hypothetical protein